MRQGKSWGKGKIMGPRRKIHEAKAKSKTLGGRLKVAQLREKTKHNLIRGKILGGRKTSSQKGRRKITMRWRKSQEIPERKEANLPLVSKTIQPQKGNHLKQKQRATKRDTQTQKDLSHKSKDTQPLHNKTITATKRETPSH
jgi:hypothetical protein